ncbi:UNVERIFIED_CONTAM: hypothetical protein HDU68_011832 [Siphonaria sp. JEL0065]|nr:hypothetical protein HDU68_011832 [Siphonaria sp. JEL0065]
MLNHSLRLPCLPLNFTEVQTVSISDIQDLFIPLNKLKIHDTHLASGPFGVIWSGTYNGERVAIKKVQVEDLSVFKKEFGVFSSLRHPNIVRIWGYSEDIDNLNRPVAMIIMSQMELNLLERVSCNPLPTLIEKTNWLLQTAKALEYLHTRTPSIIYKDLKPDNVLIDIDSVGHLSEFGLSRFQYGAEDFDYGNRQRSEYFLFAPPESYNPEYSPHTSYDIYSFGMTAYSLFCANTPFHQEDATLENVRDWVLNGQRPVRPDGNVIPDFWWALLEDCWKQTPSERLSVDYPLDIGVLDYVKNEPIKFNIKEDCRAIQLIEKIAKVVEETSIPSKTIHLFYRDRIYSREHDDGVWIEERRIKLSNNTQLKPKLANVADPYNVPSFDFAQFIDIVIHEEGTNQPPIKIRLSEFTLIALKLKIEDYIEGLKGARYNITANNINESARILLLKDDLVKESAFKGYDLHVQRFSVVSEPSIPPSPKPRTLRGAKSTYAIKASPNPPVESSPLHDWLEPVNFSADLEYYASEFVDGTRRWTLNYIWDWAADPNDSQVMWVHGCAGIGKSLISYAIIKNLPPREFILGSYFFCRFNETNKSDPASIVKGIVWDLVVNLGDRLPEFKKHVLDWMETDKYQMELNKPSLLSDPYGAFQALVVDGLKKDASALKQTVLLVIDALDECNFQTRSSILKILSYLTSSLPPFLKIFVTARPEKDIYDTLTRLSALELRPTHQDNLNDVKIVVEYRFRKLWNIIGALPPEVADCVSSLVDKSEGLFVYIRVVCEDLEHHKSTLLEARNQIAKFSSGPDDVYGRIGGKAFDALGKARFESVLGCILFANTPLDLPSLSFLASIPEEEIQICINQLRSLLKISEGRISVIHKSVKDFFLTRERSDLLFIQPKAANSILASGCLESVYSILKTLADVPATDRDIIHLLSGNPSTISLDNLSVDGSNTLATYSLANWATHLDVASFLPANILQFVKEYGAIALTSSMVLKRQHAFSKLVEAADPPERRTLIREFLNLKFFRSPILYEAAKRGQSLICENLLKYGEIDVDCRSEETNDQTPLVAAMIAKSLKTVKILVEFGAWLDEDTLLKYPSGDERAFLETVQRKREMMKIQESMSPIQRAVWGCDVVAFLNELEKVSVQDLLAKNPVDGSNILHYASEFYCQDIFSYLVSILSEFQAVFNSTNSDGITPLFIAATHGHVDALKLLIENGADVNVEAGRWPRTPLYAAAQNGHVNAISILLENDSFALVAAVRVGDVDAARLLLEHGAAVDVVENNMAPLHFASALGNEDVVQLLLEFGANANTAGPENTMPLHFASLRNHVNVVRLLLDHGAWIDAVCVDMNTPITSAIESGGVEVLRLLLERGANVDVETRNKITPLHIAAQLGYIDAVRLLLQKGANADAMTTGCWIPIQFAARNNYDEVIRLFFEMGKIPDLGKLSVGWKDKHCTKCGQDCADFCYQCREHNDVQLCSDCYASRSTLHDLECLNKFLEPEHPTVYLERVLEKWREAHNSPIVAKVPELDAFTFIQEHLEHLDESDSLIFAAMAGRVDVVRLLLEGGTDIESVQSETGITPLHMAVHGGHMDVVTLLLERGADVHTTNGPLGITPLFYAASRGHTDITRLLLKWGSDVNAKTMDEITPLIMAAQFGNVDVARILLENGAHVDGVQVNVTTLHLAVNNGVTPLYIAACNGRVHMARLLLEMDASVHAKAPNGWIPIQGAADSKQYEVVQLFLEMGKFPNLQSLSTGWGDNCSECGQDFEVIESVSYRFQFPGKRAYF